MYVLCTINECAFATARYIVQVDLVFRCLFGPDKDGRIVTVKQPDGGCKACNIPAERLTVHHCPANPVGVLEWAWDEYVPLAVAACRLNVVWRLQEKREAERLAQCDAYRTSQG